jgi:uncharacterized protein YeaO (DUF488 family)
MAFVIDLKSFQFDKAQITQLTKNVLESNLPKDLQKASTKDKYAWMDKAAKSKELSAAISSAEKAFATLLDKYAKLDAELYAKFKVEVNEIPPKLKAKYADEATKKHIPALRAELGKVQEVVKKTIVTAAKGVKVT